MRGSSNELSPANSWATSRTESVSLSFYCYSECQGVELALAALVTRNPGHVTGDDQP